MHATLSHLAVKSVIVDSENERSTKSKPSDKGTSETRFRIISHMPKVAKAKSSWLAMSNSSGGDVESMNPPNLAVARTNSFKLEHPRYVHAAALDDSCLALSRIVASGNSTSFIGDQRSGSNVQRRDLGQKVVVYRRS